MSKIYTAHEYEHLMKQDQEEISVYLILLGITEKVIWILKNNGEINSNYWSNHKQILNFWLPHGIFFLTMPGVVETNNLVTVVSVIIVTWKFKIWELI